MKLAIFVWLLTCVALAAKDYPREFELAKKGGDEKKTELLLAEWLKNEPEKPDVLISVANCFGGFEHFCPLSTWPPLYPASTYPGVRLEIRD